MSRNIHYLKINYILLDPKPEGYKKNTEEADRAAKDALSKAKDNLKIYNLHAQIYFFHCNLTIYLILVAETDKEVGSKLNCIVPEIDGKYY